MYRIKIITVGKIKKNYYLEAIAHYSKMLRPVLRIDVQNVKDCPQADGAERKRLESLRILDKIGPKDTLVALHETGRLFTSLDFASFLRPLLENPAGECCLVIGGALGLSPELLTRSSHQLSLSPLTMPHELAQVVLYEQLFRATTIMQNRTYHY
jgi:23S rRNA (pseudouridine1915-N3)-methyltransferase